MSSVARFFDSRAAYLLFSTATNEKPVVASRIEAANKAVDSAFLISEETYTEVRAQVQVNRRIRVSLPGKRGLYTLHEVIGLCEPGS